MSWNIVFTVLLIWIYSLLSDRVIEAARYTVHWNVTNPMFIVSNRDNEIDIKLSDSIDIICPTYAPGTNASKMEYYIIYMVGKLEYDSCIINNRSQAKLLIKCTVPLARPPLLYTLLIKQFQSIPGNPDFQPGKKYYFITTSGGEIHEIDNQYGGACGGKKNMRLILNVCCNGSQTAKPTSGGNPVTPVIDVTTPRPRVTTRRPTTSKTTTQTTTTTTTTVRTTPRTKKPTNTDRIPGNLPDENVIHANGPKNVGLISADASDRTMVNVAVLLVSVTIALLLR
ncbi:ephrin-B2-like isoform X2 [Haliotis rubra]|uniref:ephrin-B2-like isoform X2 n=1 Tax=Haliotis rubra TaxID=36100 RepID=UPI001EE6082C|nr:ephrin-B2-like isoform X2 [Haliotis rubra]